ncbi:hypothetical protein [uncultured Shewanella sp.]|uniref:hypothetical protein n=1 Tax=uncultured Shewanella sp. TaxID=173975 RepID=UPI00261BB649|nr:hypothetical protein [uncultured Shewanella sp.]
MNISLNAIFFEKIGHKLLIPFVLLLSACATTASTQTALNKTYQGKSIVQLVDKIGSPQKQSILGQGEKQYHWLFTETIQVPATSIHNGPPIMEGSDDEIDRVSSVPSQRICQLSVVIDKNGTIQNIVIQEDTLGTEAFHLSMCEQVLE